MGVPKVSSCRVSYPKFRAPSKQQSALPACTAVSLRPLWDCLGGQGGLRNLVEKPFPIWQSTEVSSAYALLIRLLSYAPRTLGQSRLADTRKEAGCPEVQRPRLGLFEGR